MTAGEAPVTALAQIHGFSAAAVSLREPSTRLGLGYLLQSFRAEGTMTLLNGTFHVSELHCLYEMESRPGFD